MILGGVASFMTTMMVGTTAKPEVFVVMPGSKVDVFSTKEKAEEWAKTMYPSVDRFIILTTTSAYFVSPDAPPPKANL